jgi:predicted AlkP superfamily phosphohydrolase/phosphomutase
VTDSNVTLELSGQTQTLGPGEWSDWFELDFPVNGLVDRVAPLRGITRFKLLQLEPELELYAGPINFHPDCHPVAHAWPPDYSDELADRFGLYKTIGWALDTWSLPSGVGDEQLFLDDMDFTVSKYEEMMEQLLAEDRDLYVQIFYFTDRIGHLFWRFLDPQHPLYDPVQAERWAGEMLAAYKRMDRIVGRAREIAGDEALFLVCSDHGFSSFRRGVNYNNWLVENGFMVLENQPTERATLEKLFDTGELLTNVDWSKTKAYAIGLGSIYVNLLGREREGIVLPGPEYDEVRRQIKAGLEAYEDEATGRKPVTRVWMREEMYSDFDPDLIPDMRASNDQDYRVSWQTSLGGFGREVMEDNLKPWSGDHCSNDPAVVRGIFFANRPINTDAPRMIDIMPTVLHVFGVDVPAEVDGRSLY